MSSIFGTEPFYENETESLESEIKAIEELEIEVAALRAQNQALKAQYKILSEILRETEEGLE